MCSQLVPEWALPCLPCVEDEQDKERRLMNKKINEQIRKEKILHRKQVRILLLGTGESGKSTFLKQMRILHASGFNTNDQFNFRSIIYSNIVRNMKVLVDAVKQFELALEFQENQQKMEQIRSWNREELNPATFNDFYPALISLWKDRAIQESFSMRGQFQLGESIRYYMNEIERIKEIDYLPNTTDILWARRRTDEISETQVPIKRIPFTFIDVGGQRTQREKWFQCFQESINTVLFFVAISEFDQTLVEDRRSNRIIESLKVFKYVTSHPAFRDRDIILFFNKNDILIEKINDGIKVTDYLPNMGFQGDPLKLEDVQCFFRDMFYKAATARLRPSVNGQGTRDDLGIYHHFTVAIDTDNIKKVFNAVKDMVLKENMNQLMLH